MTIAAQRLAHSSPNPPVACAHPTRDCEGPYNSSTTSKGAAPVAEVAAQAAIGERQLERLFDERIGVPPKLFARIARLRYARELESGGERHAALALRAGYADQAHFVRECRTLFGITPTNMARELGVGFVQSGPPEVE